MAGSTKPKFWYWPLIVLVAIIALITWPFDALYRALSRNLPGANQRVAQAELKRIRDDAKTAVALANGLAPDAPEIATKIEKYAARAEKKLERHVANGGWPEDIDHDSVWSYALDVLQKAKRTGIIDWRGAPDELQEELDPLLARHAVTLDWAFLTELEQADDWEALKNENFLPRVAKEVAKRGLVMAHIQEVTDSYVFAVCTPEQFKAVDGLSDHNGDMSVGAFA